MFSFIGDGDFYFYFIMVIWSLGKWNNESNYMYETNYLSMALLMGTSLSYILKSLFHHSRPFFDDLALGDTVMKDCACEFGNPSGHSLNATQFTVTIILLYTHVYKSFFKQHRILFYGAWLSGIAYIGIVVYSRIWTGRHTFD